MLQQLQMLLQQRLEDLLHLQQQRQSVSLTPFQGSCYRRLPERQLDPIQESFYRVFREQLESFISLTQVPNAQQVGFLKLHLQGGALNYFLELPTASKNKLNIVVLSLEKRYLSANRVELYKSKFQERKFNQKRRLKICDSLHKTC